MSVCLFVCLIPTLPNAKIVIVSLVIHVKARVRKTVCDSTNPRSTNPRSTNPRFTNPKSTNPLVNEN